MENIFKLLALLLVLTLSNSSLAVEVIPCSDAECVSYFKEYKRYARAGHADAMATLGELYYKGYGVDKNVNLALKQFRRAAKYNSIIGQSKAGLLYLSEPAIQDKDEGIKYLKMAARNNHGDSAALLGMIYFSINYGHYDLAQADKWFSKAVSSSSKQAREIIETVSQSKYFSPENFPVLSQMITPLLAVNNSQSPSFQSPSTTSIAINKNNTHKISWPNDGMEVITVSAPSLEDMFDGELNGLKNKYPDKYKTATGSRLPGRSCEQTLTCGDFSKEKWNYLKAVDFKG